MHYYTKADKFWKWNMNGLGYSKDGGTTYEVAITMDGAIVADFITAGVLNGDVIRAGRIQDVKNNNYWNLDTGEFRLSASAKVGESTVASKDDVDDLDDSFDQQKVFNRLTNNGVEQGIYLQNKKLYINAEYIATGVLQDSKGNVVFDLNNGKLTMKKGSIDLGNGNFTVDEEGNVFARRGTFAGTLAGAKGTFGGVVQAEDFLDSYGNSMMNGTKFSSKYLDLYGLTITNKSTGTVTFKVDGSSRQVTINGKVIMGAGSSINWATVSNSNIESNPAYSLAGDAKTLANDAYEWAELAYSAAARAHAEASKAYKMADSIEMPSYITSTYIDQTTIKSPVIEGGEFYGEEFNIIAGSNCGSFNLYGPYSSSRYHIFAIEYFESDTPFVNISSPCGGTIRFMGNLDFSDANVVGLEGGS